MKWIPLSLIALFGLIILTPIILPMQIIYRVFSKEYSLIYYFKAILYGLKLLIITIFLGKKAQIHYPYDYKFDNYFHALAIALDCLGGSIVYGSKRHTISGMCGFFANPIYPRIPNWFAVNFALEMFIDMPFGANHCIEQAVFEKLR